MATGLYTQRLYYHYSSLIIFYDCLTATQTTDKTKNWSDAKAVTIHQTDFSHYAFAASYLPSPTQSQINWHISFTFWRSSGERPMWFLVSPPSDVVVGPIAYINTGCRHCLLNISSLCPSYCRLWKPGSRFPCSSAIVILILDIYSDTWKHKHDFQTKQPPSYFFWSLIVIYQLQTSHHNRKSDYECEWSTHILDSR